MSLITSIILADDDLDDITIFHEAVSSLKRPDISLQIVRDGRDLMRLLSSFLPDLLFLDLDIPYKNGLQCLVEIGENAILKHMPTVIYSSTSKQSNIQTAYEMGAHLFVNKANNYSQLVASVQAVISLDWSKPAAIKEQHYINNRYVTFT